MLHTDGRGKKERIPLVLLSIWKMHLGQEGGRLFEYEFWLCLVVGKIEEMAYLG